jgi:retron-type reverse transcriptase
MLHFQSVQVKIRGGNVRTLVNRGCPQGGVLSPLLWIMVVDGLLRRLYNAHYQAQGYADDVVLLQKGKFISMLCDRMQGALNCVENWCRDKGLSVNADKTTMVFFMNNRKIGGFYNPRLFGTELRMTDQVKYLGGTLQVTAPTEDS